LDSIDTSAVPGEPSEIKVTVTVPDASDVLTLYSVDPFLNVPRVVRNTTDVRSSTGAFTESTRTAVIVVEVTPSAGIESRPASREMEAVTPGPLAPPGVPDSPHPISINARKLIRIIRKVIFAYKCFMKNSFQF
jgi:hypothetical protein